MHGNESTERERALKRVKRSWKELENLPERYKADREIVLAAVKTRGSALRFAAEPCKADRDIILAAGKREKGHRNGHALQYAAEELKADRELVLAVVQQDQRKKNRQPITIQHERKTSSFKSIGIHPHTGKYNKTVSTNDFSFIFSKTFVSCTVLVCAFFSEDGFALIHAAEECKADREI
eukprot:5709191-Amphidinium_carterae.1